MYSISLCFIFFVNCVKNMVMIRNIVRGISYADHNIFPLQCSYSVDKFIIKH